MFNWETFLRTEPAILTVVGMAKNAGKTVTLNYLQRVLTKKYKCIGLTSVGLDGEKYDSLTTLPKPSITIQAGTLLATAGQDNVEQKDWECLEKTGVLTPMGEVEILRAKKTTPVVIAGPSKNNEVKQVLQLLTKWGAQCILIDGAFDRQSSADPLLSNHVILSTGATLSSDLEQVISITKCRVEQLTLPACSNFSYLEMAKNSASKIIIEENDYFHEFALPTALLSKEEWVKLLGQGCSVLIVKGAVGNGLGEALSLIDNPPLIIVQDGSKIFIAPDLWKQLRVRRINFQVLNPIYLLGVTVNPVLPGGKGFEPEQLLMEMGEALSPLPVIDVMREKRFG